MGVQGTVYPRDEQLAALRKLLSSIPEIPARVGCNRFHLYRLEKLSQDVIDIIDRSDFYVNEYVWDSTRGRWIYEFRELKPGD